MFGLLRGSLSFEGGARIIKEVETDTKKNSIFLGETGGETGGETDEKKTSPKDLHGNSTGLEKRLEKQLEKRLL